VSQFLSQPVFDEETSVSFFEQAADIGVPIVMGLLPFRTAKGALTVAREVPGIRLSKRIEEQLKDNIEEDRTEFFLTHCLELAEANRGFVRGFHVISGVAPKLGLKLAKRLADYIKKL